MPNYIPAGSRVRLRTENGGDLVCYLAEVYQPTYGAYFRYRPEQDYRFWVEASRIKSVEALDARGTHDDLTIKAGAECGDIDVVRRVDTVYLTQFDQQIKLSSLSVPALRAALHALAPQEMEL